MIRRIFGLAVLGIVLCLVGCGKEETGKVFVVIDGHPITERMIRDSVYVQARIAELAGRSVPTNDFARWANKMSVELLRAYVQSTLVRNEVGRLNLTPTEEDCQKALSVYSRQSKQETKTVDELANRFGPLKAAFLDQYARTLSIVTFERQYDSPHVPDFTVRQYLIAQSNFVQKTQQIDSNAWQNANRAYARLKAGEKWSKVARELSEDKLVNIANEKFSQFWTIVNASALGMQELAEALPTMKKGDYTKPFETAEGVLIVRNEGKEQQLYKLSRILFRMARKSSVTTDFEKAREEIRKKLWMNKRQQKLEELRRKAKFEYPMGTNFNYKIWH